MGTTHGTTAYSECSLPQWLWGRDASWQSQLNPTAKKHRMRARVSDCSWILASSIWLWVIALHPRRVSLQEHRATNHKSIHIMQISATCSRNLETVTMMWKEPTLQSVNAQIYLHSLMIWAMSSSSLLSSCCSLTFAFCFVLYFLRTSENCASRTLMNFDDLLPKQRRTPAFGLLSFVFSFSWLRTRKNARRKTHLPLAMLDNI